ncbi:MAG: hypothetical protein JSV82_03065 [Planctomycetota bacterium]|nr:MAG: hypothetical protein JSV82_03065 [Planctomycetota bacterium]
MRQKLGKNVNGANRLVGQLAAEKKKTVAAVCLITVMVLMWLRVLGKKTPPTAAAAAMANKNVINNSKPEVEISFQELPKVNGRNDVLSKDFFDAEGWQNFMNDGKTEEVSFASGDVSEEAMRGVVNKLMLEAIVLGKDPQAFINDKLLSLGDKLVVKEGGDIFECEVFKIEEETVFIRCGEAEITLKLMKATEVAE